MVVELQLPQNFLRKGFRAGRVPSDSQDVGWLRGRDVASQEHGLRFLALYDED